MTPSSGASGTSNDIARRLTPGRRCKGKSVAGTTFKASTCFCRVAYPLQVARRGPVARIGPAAAGAGPCFCASAAQGLLH